MKVTDRMKSLMKMFGVQDKHFAKPASEVEDIRLDGICFINGCSGAGKSLLLQEMYDRSLESERINVSDIDVCAKTSLIDSIGGELFESLKILSRAGLSDVFCLLSRVEELSDGQKARYRLAKALVGGKKMIFIDNFCDGLDRITACVIAHNIRRVANDSKKVFVLASCHDDFLAELMPDVVVIKYRNRKHEVIYK